MEFGQLLCVDVGLSSVKLKKKKKYHPGQYVDKGGNRACVEAGCIWEISVLASQFCCTLTTALKKLFSKEKKNE